MRPLPVPVRLAAAVMAVAATAGCVNVGEDGGRASPSHSAHQSGGAAPGDGGPAWPQDDAGYGATASHGKHGHRGKKSKRGHRSASASAAPSKAGRSSTSPVKPGSSQKPADPPPTQAPPPVTTTSPEPETPETSVPPPPVTELPTAEPSSSAHEETLPQLAQREPAPEAGVPV